LSRVKERKIVIEPDKCTGCRRCQLICSFEHLEAFNPNRAYIMINEDDNGVANITFAENCDKCCICVSYCVYGALKFSRKV